MKWLLVATSFLWLSVFMRPPQAFQGCLPKEVKATEVIAVETRKPGAGAALTKKITVRDRLLGMSARCQKGKLVDASGREIYFYRLAGCWGNPPADYLEILEHQQNEIGELKKRYRVIEIPCDASAAPSIRH